MKKKSGKIELTKKKNVSYLNLFINRIFYNNYAQHGENLSFH